VPTATRSRPELSKELILDAALTLIDRDGEAELTFRRLGAELGADPTACYRHFRNKDALLLALGDRLIGEAIGSVPDGLDWRETVRRSSRAVYDALRRHPRLAVLVSVSTQGEQEARGIEQMLGALAEAGLETEQAVDVWHAIADTVLAWAGLEAAYNTLPDELVHPGGAAWTATYTRAPEDQYPHIAAARPFLRDDYDAFPLTLDLMLDGIAARLDHRRNA
jgi:AcrR family transcriptional regulator